MVRLGTDQLVPALNEQLQERRKGNDLYKARKFNAALKHYNNGLSICNFVVRHLLRSSSNMDPNHNVLYEST